LAARRQALDNGAKRTRKLSPATPEIALDPVAAAKLANLRHVSDDIPGITRHKARHGFDYRYPDGELVRDIETLKRIRSLAIPPAWTAVWICPYPNAHSGGRAGPARAQAISLSSALARRT
jgi:DNA topoisomerase I